jgi:creatinine amidohydrolase
VKESIFLQELTRDEARERAPESLIVLPVGAVEQHGPHLAVGTDYLTIDHIAGAAATEAAKEIPVVVAPTLPFGSSHHHLPFGGTISLSTETYYKVLMDMIESVVIGGFYHIYILNGHGGNNELIQLAARDIALKHPARVCAASYWTVAWDALVEEKAHMVGGLPGHAGAFETSQMMAINPGLVRDARPCRSDIQATDPRGFYQPVRIESHGFWQSIDGYTDSPAAADPERGKAYLEAGVQAVTKSMLEFYRSAGL